MTELPQVPFEDSSAPKGNYVIVCGLGGVGLRTVEQLHASGARVVVIDDDPDVRLARVVSGWGVAHLVGSARFPESLEAAGIAKATAIVVAERTDLLSLETSLVVRRLRPDVKIVVQLSNPAVGRAVSEVTGPGSIIDVAELAAPSVVEACRGRHNHQLTLGGVEFVASEVTTERHGSLRNLFGDLAPLAVVTADGGEVVVCPGRDHQVVPGDRVTVFGTPEELTRAEVNLELDFSEKHRPQNRTTTRIRDLPRRARAMLSNEADRSLRKALVALVALFIVSSIVLRLGYHEPGGGHFSTLDGLYFTAETVATVGYGDFSFAAQSTWLQVFGIVLIISGATLVTTLFALLTNLLVSRRIEQSLGRERVTNMRDHVVIIGLGSIGVRVLEGLLAAGISVVVVEQHDHNRHLGRARALGVPILIGDATQLETLELANLALARSVAILTSDDLTNIETGLVVREHLGERWLTVPVVLRVFDRALGQTVERSFGFRHVRSTSALAAPWFVGAALGLDVLGSFFVDYQPFLVGRISVGAGAGLDGLSMMDLSTNTRVVAIAREGDGGKLEHPPRRGTRFAPGDEAYLIGPYEELLEVLQRQQ